MQTEFLGKGIMLSKFSVKKSFTVFVAVIIVIILGGISAYKMTPDLFPNINTPYAIVMTTYPGASAEEAETQITEPMEQQLATLSNIKNVTSISGDNYSVISLEFNGDVNMDAVSVDIRDKIDMIEGALPEMASTPVVMKINLNMMPIMVTAVSVKDMNPREVSNFTEENLKSQLEGVEGVASLSLTGMVPEGIQVVLSQEKIDKVNEGIYNAVSAQFAEGEGQIKGGINRAKSGSAQIDAAKSDIKNGYSQAVLALSQLKAEKASLEARKAELEAKETLSAGEEAELKSIESAISALSSGISTAQDNLNQMSFEMGTTYADLSATQITLNSTIAQLQGTLGELQGSKEAALSGADITSVLTMENVAGILSAQNFSMPAGYVTDGKADVLVSVGDKIAGIDEIKNLVLFDPVLDGIDPVKLSDIATVSYIADDSGVYAKINGENGVLVSFTKQSSYATATVADNINERCEDLKAEHEGLSFVSLMDQGEYIHVVINSVLRNLLMGAILAFLILWFFLRDIRPTIIAGISIPVSVIFAIALMYFSGVTLNMISLSGLAIGVGMLVDNSIVVIENIYRLRSLGYSAVQAAVSGASQVAGAITASTLTTICVFVPIIFIDGMTKDIFKDLALTVSYSLLASLLIALTLVPAVARGLLKGKARKTVLSQNGRVIAKYKEVATWALSHKKLVVIGAVVLLLASSGILLIRGFEFMPAMSTPQITADITMAEDSTLEDTAKANDAMMAEINEIDGVETVGVMLASDTMSMMGMSAGDADVTKTSMYVVLDEKKLEQAEEVSHKFSEMAKKYGCEIVTSADMDMSAMMGGAGVTINLYSDDLDSLRLAASNIEQKLRGMDSLKEVSDVGESSTEEVKVVIDKNLAMKKGLTVAQVYQLISAKLAEEKSATKLTANGSTINVNVANTTKDNFTLEDLEELKLKATGKDGKTEEFLLTSVASIERDASLNVINHDGQKRTIKVTASIADGHNITKATSEVKKMIADENLLPAGVTAEFAGENEEIMHSMKQMLLMLVVGIVLVYLIMVAQFQSLRSPFIIIFTIPLAFTGGMLALLISGQVISVVAMMGFVMLSGIVVNNAIVLVDCINRFRLEGMEIAEAIIQAGAVRMRPVIMTAATTVLGLLPLALGIGTGAEMVQPVAITCIGGLLYATVTTLIVIPVMYRKFARENMQKIHDEELEIVSV